MPRYAALCDRSRISAVQNSWYSRRILDTAGQKGTGKWTVINSQDLGIPITLMAEAVYARCVSALKEERVKAARKLKGPRAKIIPAPSAA